MPVSDRRKQKKLTQIRQRADGFFPLFRKERENTKGRVFITLGLCKQAMPVKRKKIGLNEFNQIH